MLTGEKLGRYKIGQIIGSGGMGEVYIARDEQLDRNVALKVLLPEFCSQDERVKRFKYEAKAVSALNHPSIITIHEIAEIEEKLFIATEFIDGKTLRERIEAQDLSVHDAVKIAEQVADALAVAHEANIIHRDIKPENIIVRKDGYAKILDFGLAKPIIENLPDSTQSTEDLVKTQPGLVMGSVRYMSPEQARGTETDDRTDIWSLGVVLYEMLTGENPFDGETISDSLAAVIHKEPQPLKDVPKDLGWIIEKALQKDPKERYQKINDLKLDLHDVLLELERNSFDKSKDHLAHTQTLEKQDTSENKTLIHRTLSSENTTDEEILKANEAKAGYSRKSNGSRNLLFASAALVGIIALAGWFVLPNLFAKAENPFRSIQVSRFTDTGNASRAAVSPDGKMVAFIENKENQGKLLLRQIATGGTVEIVPFTDKGFYRPAFTPDGDFIYYVTYKNGVGTLYKIAALGGKSTQIINDIDTSVAFSPDGSKFAFVRHNAKEGGSEIIVADSNGGNSSAFLNSKDVGYEKFLGANWSADGKKILVYGFAKTDADYKKNKLIAADVETKAVEEPFWVKKINEQTWWTANNFVWLKDDSGVIFIGNPENTETRQIYHVSFSDGEIIRVTNDISNYESVSISDDGGTLVANKVDVFTKLNEFFPQTKESKEILPEDKKHSFWAGFEKTSDNKIVYTKYNDDGQNIYKLNEKTGEEEILPSDNKHNFDPNITPDERYILFRAAKEGHSTIWRSDLDGKNAKQLTEKDLGYVSDIESSPDSKYVFFTRRNRNGGKTDVMKVSIDGGQVEEVFPEIDTAVRDLSFSPTGDLVAYRIQEFDSEAEKFISSIRVSKYEGGNIGEKLNEFEMSIDTKYRWSADSKHLTFIKKEGSDNLWNIDIQTGNEIQLTNLKSEFIPHFIWSKQGEKLYIVEGKVNNDLILIKNESVN